MSITTTAVSPGTGAAPRAGQGSVTAPARLPTSTVVRLRPPHLNSNPKGDESRELEPLAPSSQASQAGLNRTHAFPMMPSRVAFQRGSARMISTDTPGSAAELCPARLVALLARTTRWMRMLIAAAGLAMLVRGLVTADYAVDRMDAAPPRGLVRQVLGRSARRAGRSASRPSRRPCAGPIWTPCRAARRGSSSISACGCAASPTTC